MSFDPKKRAEEKARSRAIDEERLMKGEISAIDLQRENCPMAAVLMRKRNVRVNLIPASKNKQPRYLVLDHWPSPDDVNDE